MLSAAGGLIVIAGLWFALVTPNSHTYSLPAYGNQPLANTNASSTTNDDTGNSNRAETNSNTVATNTATPTNSTAVNTNSSTAATALSGYKLVMTTFFWVGEPETASNGYISNVASAWDAKWMEHYGGEDTGTSRCGYAPCAFTPKENPFYVALPYNDLDPKGQRKASASQVPWFSVAQNQKSILKNHWVEMVFNNRTCYGQLEDVGPTEHDDFSYVFGDATPINQFGAKAGLDASPAVRDCLGMKDNGLVNWRFVDETAVPDGPWKQTITTSGAQW